MVRASDADTVGMLGGYGCTRDAVERHMRKANVMQLVEGTNRIQRMVIGRRLAPDTRA